MARLMRGGVLLVVLGLAAWAGVHHWRTRNLSAVQRGWAVAEAQGCFACHGPGGTRGMPDPGHGLEEVPDWLPGEMMMYARNEGEIREWILDGMPKSVRENPDQRKLRDQAVILMPAWRGILSEHEVRDLVAYIKAVSNFTKPEDENAAEGMKLASETGCFNCHGPQGRGALPNPRALKGYIPSWDGADFPELAANDEEIREWILDGVTKRFKANRLARFFLERQVTRMPAYRGHLGDAQVERIVDYIHWVRQHPF